MTMYHMTQNDETNQITYNIFAYLNLTHTINKTIIGTQKLPQPKERMEKIVCATVSSSSIW